MLLEVSHRRAASGSVARALIEAGHDALHTSQLPGGNRTSDHDLARLADVEDRVVVSKDRDFRQSHLLQGTPRRLLIVSLGNCSNEDLLALLTGHLAAVVAALESATMVELRVDSLVIHGEEGLRQSL